jgi:transglutaminase-like putative cysteine protease
VGSGLRALGVPAYAVGLVQLLIAMLSLNVIFAAGESLLGVVPTVASVRRVVFVIHNGAATLDHYSSPVGINPTHTRAMLTACALAVLLAIDVLAMGLRRPPLIALPLLITLSVPVSILRDAIALPVFVGTALLFLRLIASENLDRFRGWGSRGGQRGLFVARDQADRSRTPSNPALTVLWQVSLGAVLISLLAAPLVPVTDLLNRDRGVGTNGGTGGGYQLTAVNPFIHLRRDLVEQTHTPLVYAQTQSRSTSYLRTTVLDEFTSDSWLPSPRNLPRNNDADGVFPSPPGLSPGVAGSVDAWSLELAPNFTTTWLPLPYPIRDLNVPGTWRYDSRTLDVAYVGGGAPSQLRYNTTAFTPTITAETLDASVRAPASVRDPMTKLPDNLPAVITAQAKTVTRGAKSDFAKALALQDWFRVGGGFRYSLDQLSGSGMDLLASFVTNDRVGYCEQFAAAMAAMGRTLGIPSRVVVGFLDGAVQADGRILYTSDDRHAWPEMYFSGVGWVRFEPTPSARAGVTPEWTRQSATTPLPSAAPSRRASQAPAAPRDQSTSTTSVSGGNRSSFPWWPVAALLAVLIVGLAPGLVRRVQRRRRLAGTDPVHLAEGAWAELRATALDLGLDWPELRSPREQARRVADQVHAKDADVVALEGLLVRVERGRYGRAGSAGEVSIDADARARTMQTVDLWRKAMVGSVDRQRGWRGRMWPVSLVPRRR